MYQKILVPVDGSEPSNSGLLEAIKLAKSQNAKLKLLHVVNEHVLDTDYCIGTYAGDSTESARREGNKIMHNAAALVRQFGLESETTAVEALDGHIAPMIVAEAKAWAADLIVMGTHGRRGLKRLAMGSDAEEVVRHVRMPVLLVHDDSENTPEAQLRAREAVAG
jgi:nucleotide-binding universal stress UspA family protein